MVRLERLLWKRVGFVAGVMEDAASMLIQLFGLMSRDLRRREPDTLRAVDQQGISAQRLSGWDPEGLLEQLNLLDRCLVAS